MAHQHGHGDGHDHAHDHEHGEDDGLQGCIEECLNCHAACTMTVQYCLSEGGELADVDRVGTLLDCAELCQVSANFMLRGSPYHTVTCGACAQLCRAAEAACRDSEDEQLAACADVCAACAESCERMAAMEDEDEE